MSAAEVCPFCGVEAEGYEAERAHMESAHPEEIERRLAESRRWDGWEDS